MALPEVAQAERDAACRAADVSEAAGPRAARAVEPRVAVRRALADRERVGVRLQQGPVAERGDVLQQARDDGRDRRHLLSRHLGVARRGTGVASQACEAAHGLAEYAVVGAHEADVPIVELVAERHGEAQTQTADEVA